MVTGTTSSLLRQLASLLNAEASDEEHAEVGEEAEWFGWKNHWLQSGLSGRRISSAQKGSPAEIHGVPLGVWKAQLWKYNFFPFPRKRKRGLSEYVYEDLLIRDGSKEGSALFLSLLFLFYDEESR